MKELINDNLLAASREYLWMLSRGYPQKASLKLVGDKFMLTPGGGILTDQCPKEICVHAMTAVGRIIPVISERLVSKSDPNFEMTNIVQCSDIGLDKGGWGKILMKVYVEKTG